MTFPLLGAADTKSEWGVGAKGRCVPSVPPYIGSLTTQVTSGRGGGGGKRADTENSDGREYKHGGEDKGRLYLRGGRTHTHTHTGSQQSFQV